VLAFRVGDWAVVAEVASEGTGEWRNGFGIKKASRSVSTKYPPSICFCNPSDSMSFCVSIASGLLEFSVNEGVKIPVGVDDAVDILVSCLNFQETMKSPVGQKAKYRRVDNAAWIFHV
jgi:hypothetical protein